MPITFCLFTGVVLMKYAHLSVLIWSLATVGCKKVPSAPKEGTTSSGQPDPALFKVWEQDYLDLASIFWEISEDSVVAYMDCDSAVVSANSKAVVTADTIEILEEKISDAIDGLPECVATTEPALYRFSFKEEKLVVTYENGVKVTFSPAPAGQISKLQN
jgi:hypothetical protein